jgi:hypothetical protein
MVRVMTHKTFALIPVSGSPMNPNQFVTRTSTFATNAADGASFTLLVTKEDGRIRDFLVLDEKAADGNALVPTGRDPSSCTTQKVDLLGCP